MYRHVLKCDFKNLFSVQLGGSPVLARFPPLFFKRKKEKKKQTRKNENARARRLSRQHDAIGAPMLLSNITARAINSGKRILTKIEINTVLFSVLIKNTLILNKALL